MSGDLALIEARLGRPPQDMLEAAVALEAWAGVPAQGALESGARLMQGAARAPLPSAAVLPPPPRRPELVLEGLAFVASVLAIALWAAPLADALGAAAVGRALTLALPLTLALQWGLRSRYLSRPRGLAELGGAGLGAAAVVVATVPWLVFGDEGAVAGLLTVTWTGGTVLIRRGWALGYAAIVLAATPPMTAGAAPLTMLGATAAVTAAAVAAALRAPAAGDRRAPGRWGRAGACALLGAGLGTLLVADPSTGWSTGASPALALLPSAVAGIWAGERLWRIDHAIPRALAGIPAVGEQTGQLRRVALPAPVGILLGAVARLAGASIAGSLLLAVFVPVAPGLLVAFALLVLATLLVSLLEAMGRTGWAALGVACALAAELALRHPPFAGAGLAAGAAVGVALLLPAAVAPLLRPARTLATTLWIA